ncbi:MAG: hypothetical protein WBJ19_15005, partial [Rhodoferax sp.]
FRFIASSSTTSIFAMVLPLQSVGRTAIARCSSATSSLRLKLDLGLGEAFKPNDSCVSNGCFMGGIHVAHGNY